MKRISFAIALAAIPVLSLSLPAEAKIMCVKGMQVVNGSLISTPYCQDALVATVAQQHGMNVSAAAIRNNPNLKRSACRLVHSDIRVSEGCALEPSVRIRF